MPFRRLLLAVFCQAQGMRVSACMLLRCCVLQNVTDALSSKAFLSLSASFPVKPHASDTGEPVPVDPC